MQTRIPQSIFKNKSEYAQLCHMLQILARRFKPEGSDVEVHPQACTVVWGILGAPHWVNKGLHQEGTGEIVCKPPRLADYRGRSRGYPQRSATNVCFVRPLRPRTPHPGALAVRQKDCLSSTPIS